MNHLNAKFDSVPKSARLCIDEQMCSTKMISSFRQYMPNKPHKWGMKLFVLFDTSGYSYKFEVYHGGTDNVLIPGVGDMGATSNVVVRLSQTINDLKNHILYFDNFYTSLPLLFYLRSRGIYSLGTIRSNRISNCQLPSDKEISKEPIGHSVEYIANVHGVDITTVLWKDTKAVRLASTYVGVQPFQKTVAITSPNKAVRYNRKDKSYISIDCPRIIREYNHHMGGVDLMDGLLGRYQITMKTHSASKRLFFHFIDMAVVNAYLLYRRFHGKNSLNLPDFREEVAEALCYAGVKGRPRAAMKVISGPKRSYDPVSDIRFDKKEHTPDMLDRTMKKTCKYNGCLSSTQIICKKCNVNLCLRTTRKCFHLYHEK